MVSLVGVDHLALAKEDMAVSRFGLKARSCCEYIPTLIFSLLE